MISTHNLAVVRGERLLFRDVNFEVGPGQALRITGANGSGKTTLLRILAGLSEPAQGEVHWCGEKIARCREQFHRQLNFSGHQYGLRGDLTALENLRYLIVDPVSDSALIESMARVGLGHCADLPARYLSQGQRRRLLLARLQATRSTCWILDEPLAALDHEGIALVEKFCAEHLEAGGILIITSHQELSVSLRDSSELHLGGHNHA